MTHRFIKVVGATLVAIGMLVGGCSSKGKQAAQLPLTSEQKQLNLESFDMVWNTIKAKHFDPKLNGADWEGAKTELRPKIEQAKNMNEARAVLGDLIGRLKQTHFGIIPAEAYNDLPGAKKADGSKADENGTSGIQVRVADGLPVVWKLDPESSAAAAGVGTGWQIVSVDGKKISKLLDRLKNLEIEESMKTVYQSMSIQRAMQGAIGETRTVVFRDGSNALVTKAISMQSPSGTAAVFGNMPKIYVRMESKEIVPKIGYISLNAFFDPMNVNNKYKAAIEQFEKADGLIIDLRGNPGGIGAMAMGLGGYLVNKDNQKLGEMVTRDAKFNFLLNPQPTTFDGPLAVLVDEMSMSTSEIFAGGLQDLGRARIFGIQTPGAALPSTIEKLPNGDGFQYAFANYISFKGQPLEGKGVEPDEIIPLHRDVLLAGRDPVIEAAIGWIGCEKK